MVPVGGSHVLYFIKSPVKNTVYLFKKSTKGLKIQYTPDSRICQLCCPTARRQREEWRSFFPMFTALLETPSTQGFLPMSFYRNVSNHTEELSESDNIMTWNKVVYVEWINAPLLTSSNRGLHAIRRLCFLFHKMWRKGKWGIKL